MTPVGPKKHTSVRKRAVTPNDQCLPLPQAEMEPAENHFLRARKGRVKFFSTCGWAGLGQGETP